MGLDWLNLEAGVSVFSVRPTIDNKLFEALEKLSLKKAPISPICIARTPCSACHRECHDLDIVARSGGAHVFELEQTESTTKTKGAFRRLFSWWSEISKLSSSHPYRA